MNRRKGETDMGHFSFVAESQPSESSPMTVTYSLWINHSAWLQNAHHFLYPTAVYIGHSSGIILTKNTDIVSKWGKCMCHQNFNASIWKMGHLEENIKSTGDRESVCPCTHWLKLRSWGNVLRVRARGVGLGEPSIQTWWWRDAGKPAYDLVKGRLCCLEGLRVTPRGPGRQGQGRMDVPRSERSCSWSSGWGAGPRWNFPAGMAESRQDEALSTDAVVCSDIFRLSVE